jgi:IS5 family transposase
MVDKGCRGVELGDGQILRSGQRRGITPGSKAMIKRRSAIEPTIGHIKMEDRLARNPLKGTLEKRCTQCSMRQNTTSVFL